MRGLANPESKIYSLLNKMALMVELNIWVLLCCLPVVTAGAAVSSMHGVLLRLQVLQLRELLQQQVQTDRGCRLQWDGTARNFHRDYQLRIH